MRSVWRSGRVPEVIKRKRNQDLFSFFLFLFFRQDYTTLSASRRETWFGDVEEFEIGLRAKSDGTVGFAAGCFVGFSFFGPPGLLQRVFALQIHFYSGFLRFIKFASSSNVPQSIRLAFFFTLNLALPQIFLEFLLELLSIVPFSCLVKLKL